MLAAVRLTDGRIAIANNGTSEIRFYGSDGRFLFATGGGGEGPGEFRYLQRLWRYRGDSLLARDLLMPRLSVFDTNGQFIRAVTLESRVVVIGVFDDGSLLAQGSARIEGDPAGLHRYDVPLHRLSPDGKPLDDLGVHIGSEGFHQVLGNRIVNHEPFFARKTQYLAAGLSLYVAPTDTYEFALRGSRGALRTLVRREFTPLTVTTNHRSTRQEALLANARDDNTRRRWERAFDEMPVRSTMPAYAEIHVGDLQNIWVREYNEPGDEQIRWTVFDGNGLMLGEVPGRDGFTPYHIGADFMLGRWRDADDVEHVRLYDLTKPGQ